jgi:cyclohexadienyl dehydratase
VLPRAAPRGAAFSLFALSVKVAYVHTAWPRLSADFEADRFDMAMGGISITPEREAKGLFSTPIMQEGKTPIARCADQGKYQTLADIDHGHPRHRQSWRHQ